jgi:hypothetical protein
VRILFSGSRTFYDDQVVILMLERLIEKTKNPSAITVVHGGAPGLDSIVGILAKSRGMQVEIHRADWHIHGKAAGVLRNQKMVDLGADLVVAYPLPGGSGTQDCIQRAVKTGIPTLVYDSTSGNYTRWSMPEK